MQATIFLGIRTMGIRNFSSSLSVTETAGGDCPAYFFRPTTVSLALILRLRAANEFAHPGDGNPHGRPKIWIAEDKHSNYPNRTKCDQGANWTDNRDQPINALELHSVQADRNVGNREGGTTQLLNCISRTAHGGGGTLIECLWTYPSFRGWQSKYAEVSTGYTRLLDAFDF
jgi:hypothetical protein